MWNFNTSACPKRKYRFWYIAVLWIVLFNYTDSCWDFIALVTDEWVECCWQGKAEALGEKHVSVPIRLPQISRGMTQDSTLTYAVRYWRLTAPAIAQPRLQCCACIAHQVMWLCLKVACVSRIIIIITYTVELRSSWEASSFPARKFIHVLWKSDVH